MINASAGDRTLKQDFIRDGSNTVPTWSPIKGLVLHAFPDEIYINQRICDLQSVGDVSLEETNARTGFQVGKSRAELNDGNTFTTTLTINGNALGPMAALSGKDLTGTPSLYMGQNILNAGDLFMYTGNSKGDIIGTELFLNAQVKQTGMAGAQDGESSSTFDVITTSAPIKVLDHLVGIKEIFYNGPSPADNGVSITNTDAPDGVMTAFKLGDGNHTGITLHPLAQKFDPDASGADQYFAVVRINGTEASGYTYDTATSTLNFATAPAANSYLEIIYFVKSEAESYDSTKRYGIGSIVNYNGSYYIGDATSEGTTPAGVSPWLDYTGFGWDDTPTAQANPIMPYFGSTTHAPFLSWDRVMYA